VVAPAEKVFESKDVLRHLRFGGAKMFFKLSTKKAIEAAALLLRMESHKAMGRKRLLALLYLADRRAFQESCRPILGGRLCALENGPIHSEIYDLIKGSHSHPSEQAAWARHFGNDCYKVTLDNDPGVAELSQYEIDVLTRVAEEVIALGEFDVAHLTHFPEWTKVYQSNTSTPISPEIYIDAVGHADKKDKIFRDAEEKTYFDNLFAGEK
jgi:uncharacterized phage-associated protein